MDHIKEFFIQFGIGFGIWFVMIALVAIRVFIGNKLFDRKLRRFNERKSKGLL